MSTYKNTFKGRRILDEVRYVMRLHHYSIHTERTYCDWIKRYIQYNNMTGRHDLIDGSEHCSLQSSSFEVICFRKWSPPVLRNPSMNKGPGESEDRIREQFREDLKETLSAKGQRRWGLLEEFALEHGYTREGGYCYRYEKNYVMKITWNIIYIENVTTQAYEEIRGLLEGKGKIQTSPSVIANALTIGGSTLGGAFLGFLLIRAGLHPLVLIPSIMIPPGLCIYEMLKQSAKESGKLAKIEASLRMYQDHIYYDDDAVRRFHYRAYKNALVDR